MCQGKTQTGTACRRAEEPYCWQHTDCKYIELPNKSVICWLPKTGWQGIFYLLNEQYKLKDDMPVYIPLKVDNKIIGHAFAPKLGDIVFVGSGQFTHIGIFKQGYNTTGGITVGIYHCTSNKKCSVDYINQDLESKSEEILTFAHYIGPKAEQVRKKTLHYVDLLQRRIDWSLSSVCSYVLGFCKETNNKTLIQYAEEYIKLLDQPEDKKISGICSSLVLLSYLFAFHNLKMHIATYFPFNPFKCTPYNMKTYLPRTYWLTHCVPRITRGYSKVQDTVQKRPVHITLV